MLIVCDEAGEIGRLQGEVEEDGDENAALMLTTSFILLFAASTSLCM